MECSEIKLSGVTKQKTKKVGHSKFYDVSSCIVASEKQDIMKPEDYIEEGKLPYKCILHKNVKDTNTENKS